ncbi:MAG: hypothetical protein KZY74_11665, partial [Paenibacillaceae bacterium]|nr:hypothetical protein [Paenibacillaceae bacterium]
MREGKASSGPSRRNSVDGRIAKTDAAGCGCYAESGVLLRCAAPFGVQQQSRVRGAKAEQFAQLLFQAAAERLLLGAVVTPHPAQMALVAARAHEPGERPLLLPRRRHRLVERLRARDGPNQGARQYGVADPQGGEHRFGEG